MNFLQPLGFIGLISIPIILALYFFKNKKREITVPSTFLWLKTRESLQAERSMEKLQKNLLLLLQLIAALMCVLALTSPYIKANRSIKNINIVVDNSLSMSVSEGKFTRLDLAKEGAKELVKSQVSGSKFSISTLNSEKEPILVLTDNKKEVLKAIDEIKQSYAVADFDNLLPEEGTVFFTDEYVEADNIICKVYGEPFNNISVTSLTAVETDTGYKVLARVKNNGNCSVNTSLGIYGDNKLLETLDIALLEGENKDFVANVYGKGISTFKAALSDRDKFGVDDIAYYVNSDSSTKKVLISGENPFIDRVFSVMPYMAVTKNTGDIESLSGYDLYVFEGKIPDNLPKDGHYIIFNPEENNHFKVENDVLITDVTESGLNPVVFTDKVEFSLLKSKKIELPSWGREIITSKETPLIFIGDIEGNKACVFGFDLSNSDLPLKSGFPVLIYDILNNMFGSLGGENANLYIGDEIKADISPKATAVTITDPMGNEKKLSQPFSDNTLRADSVGVYYISQSIEDNKDIKPVAVNLKPIEKDFSHMGAGNTGDINDVKGLYNYELKYIFIILCILVLIGEFWLYIYRYRHNLYKPSLAIRAICLLLILASVFDPQISLPTKGVTTVFALDMSDSMNSSPALDFINKAMENKPSEDKTALITFGNGSQIIEPPKENVKAYKKAYISDSSATDIATAIKTADSLFNKSSGKRLVILTDGGQTRGDGLDELKAFTGQVKVVDYSNLSLTEAELKEFKVPEYISSDNFNSEIAITSTVNQTVLLEVYAGSNKLYSSDVDLKKGENRFTVPCQVGTTGDVELRAIIKPQQDKYKENNALYANTYYGDKERILIIDYDNSGLPMENLLKASDLYIDRVNVANAPGKVAQLNKYEEIILCDTPYYEMNNGFVSSLKEYVKTSAGGVLVTAGENSLAPGGYKGTELEEILPVNMDLTDETKKKKSAFVMVVDRSGSMSSGEYGISKLELAKEAMVRSVETLDKEDSVGVVAFDDGFNWTVNLGEVKDKDNVINKIYTINSGGGTSIQPALKEAVSKLVSYNADSKHILLMTDGQGETTGYEPIIEVAKSAGITISTVAVGNDSDTGLLETIAKNAGGRYYFTNVFSDLPKIFEKEALLSNKVYINNEPFYADCNTDSSILTGITSVPELGGYVASKPKSTSDIIMSHNNDPILTKWEYGMGKTAVFASDLESHCGNFLYTSEGQKILLNTVSELMRVRVRGAVQTELAQRDGKLILTLKAKDMYSAKANIGEGRDINLSQTRPGIFTGELPPVGIGNYVLNLSMIGEQGESFNTSVISVPYSREYSIDVINNGGDVVKALGGCGEIISDPGQVFTAFESIIYDKLDVGVHCLVLGLILLLSDLILRRFRPVIKPVSKKDVKPREIKEKSVKTNKTPKSKPKKDIEEVNVTSTSSLLLKNKQKREK